MDQPFGKRVGGALCLDFVNTVRGRVGAPASRRGRDYADRIVGERIPSYDALISWSIFAQLLTAREASVLKREAPVRPADASTALGRAQAVREAMYRLFKAAIEGWAPDPSDLTVLNRELQIARGHQRLVAAPQWQWDWDECRRPNAEGRMLKAEGRTPNGKSGRPGAESGAPLDRMLWPVVLSAADLLTGPALDRVGQCPGSECGWLFLDTSRSRRRQWCDMAECGNLSKVHRFRERRRTVG